MSQDTTSYGRDLGPRTDLPRLLKALGNIGGKFWIRLLYGYPSGITDRLLETMASVRQVCHYLDVPIQHAHKSILKSMARGTTFRHLQTMAGRIRSFMPDAAIRTTCLVGFPGETQRHFRTLLDFVIETEFDHLGVFVFSPEEQTAAFAMPQRPSTRTAERRRRQLMIAQQKVVNGKAARMIGSTDEILIEGFLPEDRSVMIGRSSRQAPEVDGRILLRGLKKNVIGTFVKARYTEAVDYDMRALVCRRRR